VALLVFGAVIGVPMSAIAHFFPEAVAESQEFEPALTLRAGRGPGRAGPATWVSSYLS
jgi:hypothetical protein